jgi:RNA polymerase sigma-70 factor (ECF subfamily)
MDDVPLVRAARRGDAAACAALYRRHAALVWRAAYAVVGQREAAEDVLQETFVQAFAALGRFDERRPLEPWLRRIAVRRALNWRRSARPERSAVEGVAEGPYARVEGDDELLDAVRTLPEERRQAVALRYWLDLPPAEIGELLGVPEGTIRSRLARALRDLRTVMEEHDVEPA